MYLLDLCKRQESAIEDPRKIDAETQCLKK